MIAGLVSASRISRPAGPRRHGTSIVATVLRLRPGERCRPAARPMTLPARLRRVMRGTAICGISKRDVLAVHPENPVFGTTGNSHATGRAPGHAMNPKADGGERTRLASGQCEEQELGVAGEMPVGVRSAAGHLRLRIRFGDIVDAESRRAERREHGPQRDGARTSCASSGRPAPSPQ